MSVIYEERLSDSPYIETVTRGQTFSDGSTIRPAESNWHMVITRVKGRVLPIIVGPWKTAGIASWGEGAEILWIKFKLGTFMPHLPAKKFLETEIILPEAASNTFWLKGAAWQFPDFENAETFVNRLVHDEVLVCDPVINAALQDQRLDIPSRTVRHRFLHAAGLSQTYIRQMRRAQQAAALLQRGVSILDVVYQLGYFDQPHLTRSLKQFVGYTPAHLTRMNQLG